MDKRIIKLPRGGDLEIECTPIFYEKIRQHFDLSKNDIVDDEHIRMFIYGACKTAIDEAEEELLNSKTS